jgi:transposase
MAIKRHKRGNRTYVAEYKNVREGNKVKSVYIRHLYTEEQDGKRKKPKRRVLDKIDISTSSRAGDIKLLWHIASDLELVNTIDRICCGESDIEGPSPGKLLTIWAINRVIDPESATQLSNWVPTTNLPRLAGIDPDEFTKDLFYEALDYVCMKDVLRGKVVDFTQRVDDALFQRWRELYPLPKGEKETLAYDMTSILFFGVTCPLAELGYNVNKVKRVQVNLALLITKNEKHPMSHFVYNGNRHTSSTVKNFLVRLNESAVEPGTLIFDRGNVSKKYVELVEDSGWDLICGIPKTSKSARSLIEDTDIPAKPGTYARKTKKGTIYAIKKKGKLFGKGRTVVVYKDWDRCIKDINNRNENLVVIGKELDKLSEKGKNYTEKRLHKEIRSITKSFSDFVDVRVSRKRKGPRVVWKFLPRKIERTERLDGKWLILCTDKNKDMEEIVNTYLEKDFIEKVFRTIKTDEDVEPVRHRLEHRVRAYIFVCVLAYRLSSTLQWMLKNASAKEDSWEQASELLRNLGRVERVEVKFGKEIKTWYLNMNKYITDTLKAIDMPDLFKEKTRLEM